MLARIAESLYWMGRYTKRAEYLSRFLRVQYFENLETQMFHDPDFSYNAILKYSGEKFEEEEVLQEEDVLERFAFDKKNPSSIYSTVVSARENARGVRHIISSELWEVVNKHYLFVTKYNVEDFKTRTLYDFTKQLEEQVKNIEANISSTLKRDNVPHFIYLGLQIEKTLQIARILKIKILEVPAVEKMEPKIPLMQHHWLTTLKTLETFDMYLKDHRNDVNIESVANYFIKNSKIPRSLYFNLKQMDEIIRTMDVQLDGFDKLTYLVAKLEAKARFFEYKSRENLLEFVKNVEDELLETHNMIAELFFKSNNN